GAAVAPGYLQGCRRGTVDAVDAAIVVEAHTAVTDGPAQRPRAIATAIGHEVELAIGDSASAHAATGHRHHVHDQIGSPIAVDIAQTLDRTFLRIDDRDVALADAEACCRERRTETWHRGARGRGVEPQLELAPRSPQKLGPAIAVVVG